jgi:sulfite reductase (NADPH) flavoprotein alpha-component
VLKRWHESGLIQLITAFSRDQESKIYVQTRLRELGELVWQVLTDGGHFYVCGDASSMAGAVEAELLAIAKKYGKMTELQAEAWLNSMSDSHRYQRDVWF